MINIKRSKKTLTNIVMTGAVGIMAAGALAGCNCDKPTAMPENTTEMQGVVVNSQIYLRGQYNDEGRLCIGLRDGPRTEVYCANGNTHDKDNTVGEMCNKRSNLTFSLSALERIDATLNSIRGQEIRVEINRDTNTFYKITFEDGSYWDSRTH